jgi:hypothetical protein
MRMLAEDELREAVLLIFANKQVYLSFIFKYVLTIMTSLLSLYSGFAERYERRRNHR